MNDVYKTLSKHLYEVMDIIGASEDIRWKYWQNATLHEVFLTLKSYLENRSAYRFGSSCEGTTTQGLRSDMDQMHCHEEWPVVEKLEDAPEHGGSFLMVTDINTKPGYFQLQTVINRTPQTIHLREIVPGREDTDQYGRICYAHFYSLLYRSYACERHGPADTVPRQGDSVEQDHVYALRCQTIPSTTNIWVHRNRPYNWPSQNLIKTMMSYGCFFVGVGRHDSRNKSIEWRISFSLQERVLMSSLNPTQHKVYILLKMIKKDIIQPRADKSISSYHLKTCLFYVIQNSSKMFWSRNNMLQATRICLAVLLRFVKEHNCPNYFVPNENMFDRLDANVLRRVATVLEEVLSSGVSFLLLLKCDDVCTLLCKTLFGQSTCQLAIVLEISPIANILRKTSVLIYNYRNWFLRDFCIVSGVPTKCLFRAFILLQYLEYVDCVTEHTRADTRAALSYIIPHIHLQVVQSIASVMLESEGIFDSLTVSRIFLHHIKESLGCDLISPRLTLATCFLTSEMFEVCEHILLECENSLDPSVVSVCNCHDSYHPEFIPCSNVFLNTKLAKDKLSAREYQTQCVTGCMLFLPGQASIVHPALHYEMYRSLYTQPGSRDESDFWMDWIVVDSRVYLYFLLYIVYSKTNKHVHKRNAMDNLRHLIMRDNNLGHRETACNLFGWMCIQENKQQEAVLAFNRSWQLRPLHNAAKWHIATMSNDLHGQTDWLSDHNVDSV